MKPQRGKQGVCQSNCQYNSMVDCSGDFRPCHRCGWNPDVRQRRVQSFMENGLKKRGPEPLKLAKA